MRVLMVHVDADEYGLLVTPREIMLVMCVVAMPMSRFHRLMDVRVPSCVSRQMQPNSCTHAPINAPASQNPVPGVSAS
jgi:hypothetical protein